MVAPTSIAFSSHPSATMILKSLRLWDIRTLHRLERQIFPLDAYPYLDLTLMLLTPGMLNLKVVDPADQLLGFIAVGDVWWSGRPAWIITVGVGKAHQNQGIGRYLMQAIESRLQATHIRLTVRASNAPARHLYHQLGYAIVREQRGYYNDGETGVVMEKWLPPPTESL